MEHDARPLDLQALTLQMADRILYGAVAVVVTLSAAAVVVLIGIA